MMRVRGRKFPQTAIYGVPAAGGGGGGYVGPGDIQTFTLWSGLRAYSAAKAAATVALVDLVDQAGANPITINCTTAGALDASAIATWVAAHSVTTIKVSKLYDQVGSNHLAQVTLANMPTLVANALNSSYGMSFNGTSTQLISTSSLSSQAQPYLFSMLLKAASAADYGLVSIDVGDFGGFVSEWKSLGNIRSYAGANIDVAISTNAWHAVQMLANSTSSVLGIDGSETTGDDGTQNTENANLIFGQEGGGANFFNGSLMELGFAAGAVSSGNRASLNSNMHAAYGGW